MWSLTGCPSLGELSLRWVSCEPTVRAPILNLWGYRRAHLVVLALEVGGRWSRETQAFVTQLARAKARGETQLMRRRAEQPSMGFHFGMCCGSGRGVHIVGAARSSRL